MPKYQIQINAFGLHAGQVVEGEPDAELIEAGIFKGVTDGEDESGESEDGPDGGDGSSVDEGGNPGPE